MTFTIDDIRGEFITEVPKNCFLDPRFHEIDNREKVWDSRTKQSFKDEVNINTIVGRFMKNGVLPQRGGEPFYGDVTEIGDYQSCLNKVNEANELFEGMTAKVREKFDNDPANMIEFLKDEKNLDEAIALGLAVKRPVSPVDEAKEAGKGSGTPPAV